MRKIKYIILYINFFSGGEEKGEERQKEVEGVGVKVGGARRGK